MASHETRTRSSTKSVIWRLVGVIVLAAVTYAYTRQWIQTGLITFIHHAIFLIVFYLHERLWLRIPITNRHVRALCKMFTYETLCGNIILGIITYAITGSFQQMTQITLTYIGIKHVIYVFNEFLWDRLRWGRRPQVYMTMCADLFHHGHVNVLRAAARLGDVTVGLLTDEAVAEYKDRPVMSYDERRQIVEATRYVKRVIPHENGLDYTESLRRLRPDYFVHADDWRKTALGGTRDGTLAVMKEWGGKVVEPPYTEGISSSDIKRRIRGS